jgi:hypothetical protein
MKFILALLLSIQIFAQKSDRIANYDINVELDTKNKTLLGSETLTWTNTSLVSVNELQFHLYLNAFKDQNSTFMRESGGQLRGNSMDKNNKENFGNIYITQLKINEGENLYSKIKFIQPDDLNSKDRTVISLDLKNAVLPGQTIKIAINFKAKLPKIFARTGWAANDYFLVGQWFPKIGVLEKDGKWNCHQFHANTEFFADFGVYNVKILAPENFKIGATGAKIGETKIKNNKTLHQFLAEDVHDFAFTASPHFKIFKKTHKEIELLAFMQPEHAIQSERYFQSAIVAIDYLNKNVGKYPHKTLTMVDPPLAGAGSGGMEYPTFITCGSFWGVGKWGKFAEVVTIHEFAHQYFQGMLATNEFEESWLDEGFTQYYEGRIMNATYLNGAQLDLFGFQVNDLQASRQGYVAMNNPSISQSYRNAWEYPAGSYGILTYQKTATWLKTLEGLLGKNNMDLVMKTYFEKWKFKHPKAQDFINVVNEVAAKKTKFKDMDWFFKQVLFEAPYCDYSVSSIKNAPRKETAWGKFTVERKGEMVMPGKIKVVFVNNKAKIIEWNGKDRLKTFSFKERIKYVRIDPELVNWMDLNRVNNGRAIKEPTKVASKFALKVLFWVQNILGIF